MASRNALGGLLVALGVATAVACGNYEPPDVATYGQPNGLSHNPLPPNGVAVSEDAGTTPPAGDGGGTTPSEGGTPPPTVTLACVKAGGTVVDGGTCGVSWSQTIYPAIQGAWGCASATCHGGTATPPLTGTSSALYASLANFTTINSLPYFSPCSTDPTKSTFVCNTATTAPCGTGGTMPLTAGLMTPTGLTQIATWVACGAPEN